MTKGAFPRLSDFPYLSRMKEMEKLLKAGGMSARSAIKPAFAVAGAAKPLFQLGLGIIQGARARSISRRNPRPTYNIPGAATNALYDQRNLAYGQTPGMNTAMQQLAQNQAGSISGIQNSGGGGAERLAALTMLDQNAGNQALDLAAMQEQFKERQMQNYIGAQNAYAGYQEKKRDWDVMQPYLDAQAKAAAMNDAANVNIHGALGEAGGIVSSVIKKGAGTPTPGVVTNPYGRGPVAPVAAAPDPTKEYQSLLNIEDPTMPRTDGSVGSVYPSYISKTPILTPGADDSIQTQRPTTDPYSGLSTVEAGKSPAAILPQDSPIPDPKGPFPIGYDPKTKNTNPVAGPQNYNPMPEEPKGPFPIGMEPAKNTAKDIVSEVDAIDPEIAAKIYALLKGAKNKRKITYDLAKK